MTIVVDIGGTYARFARLENGGLSDITKLAAADFPRLEEALKAYVNGKPQNLRIATAAHPDANGLWRFVTGNAWVMDPKALAKTGFQPDIILNDFEAATWGLLKADEQSLKVLKKGTTGKRKCLIGPGTGLGLGYLCSCKDNPAVQKTMGGHIAAAAVTAEQELVLQTVRRIKRRSGVVVYEDVVSGPGLINLYRALCDIDGKQPEAEKPEDLVETHSPQAHAALRLFHEFFALFAAGVVVSGDAHGGLYLMGGVMDKLVEKNLFNAAHFESFFVGDYVPAVRAALDHTPVYHVTDPYIALKGLAAYG